MALRRSAWLIAGLVVLGAVTMNGVKQLSGPQYQATGRVLLSSTDLASGLAGIDSVYVDPSRRDSAETNIANSPPLYEYAAQQAGGRLGTGSELDASTTASANNNIVAFVSTSGDQEQAQAIANAVADAYPQWRADVSGKAIESAIIRLREQIQQSGANTELQDELRRLQLLKTLTTTNTLLVDPASRAVRTTPNPVRDTLLGATLGLLIALLVVGARELLDTRVRSEVDVEEILGTPVLATVHTLPKSLRDTVVGGTSTRFSDEYDLLAATIRQMFDGHDGPVHIAVTSALPGEGKTTTTANLASALARRGESVVLADFDLRNPRLGALFSIPKNVPGVTELLFGYAELDSALWNIPLNGDGAVTAGSLVAHGSRHVVSAHDHVGSLTVLPGGRSTARSASAASFARLPELLSEIDAGADFVVIDTPPALIVSGMTELGPTIDAAIVVARQGTVTRRQLRTLNQQTRSWRPKLIGAVLNDVPRQESELAYGSYYGRV